MVKGISIAQQGVDVKQALDSQKVMDSRWKYMDILIEQKISIPDLTQPNTVEIFAHKLGFLPAFDLYSLKYDAYIAPVTFSGGPGPTETLQGGLVSSKDAIYFKGIYTDPGWSNSEAILRIYNVAITEEYAAPIELTDAKSTSKPSNVGVKILGRTANGDMNERELSHYGLNTKGKALAIQRTGVVAADAGTNFFATVVHNLGAPPNFLATFCDFQREQVGAIASDFIPFLANANTSELTFRGAQATLIGNVAYIIFKEFAELAI